MAWTSEKSFGFVAQIRRLGFSLTLDGLHGQGSF